MASDTEIDNFLKKLITQRDFIHKNYEKRYSFWKEGMEKAFTEEVQKEENQQVKEFFNQFIIISML